MLLGTVSYLFQIVVALSITSKLFINDGSFIAGVVLTMLVVVVGALYEMLFTVFNKSEYHEDKIDEFIELFNKVNNFGVYNYVLTANLYLLAFGLSTMYTKILTALGLLMFKKMVSKLMRLGLHRFYYQRKLEKEKKYANKLTDEKILEIFKKKELNLYEGVKDLGPILIICFGYFYLDPTLFFAIGAVSIYGLAIFDKYITLRHTAPIEK